MTLPVALLLSKAKSLVRKGDLATAAKIYQSVLQRFPKNKRAIDGLRSLQQQSRPAQGSQPPQNQINALITLLQQGRLHEIVQHATPMTRNFPNAIAPHDLLGIAHMGLQNYDKCIACYQKALQIKPDFAEAHNNLGAALRAQGHFDAAIASYQKALRLKPDYAEAHNNLGIAQQESGDVKAAITSFENALHIQPDYADAHFNLGSALTQNSALTEAIASFEKGLSIAPGNAEAQNHLGNAQQECGDLDAAVISYRKALKIDPQLTKTYLNLGSVFKAQGHLDDAVASYKKALQIKPEYAEAYRNYTSAVKFKTEDEYTRKIANLLTVKSLPENDQMHLNFALAKAKLDMGQAADGIKLLKTGNALRKKELNYDISIDEDLFCSIKKLFKTKTTKISIDDKTTPTPIFILGMPRSGTTLVEQIISNHSDVYGAGELKFLTRITNNIDLDTVTLTDDLIQNIRADYFEKVAGLNTDLRFITDKTPANFRWIGFITQAFPEAKIIHTSRNPAAVCWSQYKLYFPAGGIGYSFDMRDVAHYYGLYQDLMRFWHMHFPNRIYDLNYEQLTENQLEQTRNLLTYLELDWQDAVMDFHKNTRSVATISSQQVRRKMYKGSSQEWEKYKGYLGPMLNILETLPKG